MLEHFQIFFSTSCAVCECECVVSSVGKSSSTSLHFLAVSFNVYSHSRVLNSIPANVTLLCVRERSSGRALVCTLLGMKISKTPLNETTKFVLFTLAEGKHATAFAAHYMLHCAPCSNMKWCLAHCNQSLYIHAHKNLGPKVAETTVENMLVFSLSVSRPNFAVGFLSARDKSGFELELLENQRRGKQW